MIDEIYTLATYVDFESSSMGKMQTQQMEGNMTELRENYVFSQGCHYTYNDF